MDVLETVLEFARENGIRLSREEAIGYLASRAALARNPGDPEARRLSVHWGHVLNPLKTWEDFDRPECPHDCPECADRNRLHLEHTLEFYRSRGLRQLERPG